MASKSKIITAAIVHQGGDLLVKKWLPLILLIVFIVISVAALSGLARNLAQKTTVLSDPLCKVVWKKKKPYQFANHGPGKEVANH
ncbi:hypothetical protein [Nitrosospira sp. Nsp13]|uniref:hypothetical protein n=1 Tax=Nitrosospira sp. Nsp13 TaxID=1855332 RepID=UPI000890FA4E|nr:hypothetical protein [Nitrosospira sp. Nsp13]SCX80346.1 hypothetical protein SAMN05216308_101327 [Nitrosospira sp. Nsp13]